MVLSSIFILILLHTSNLCLCHDERIQYFTDRGGCGGCLYMSYKVELQRLAIKDKKTKDAIEPRIWCTQTYGNLCSDFTCDANVFWDPFACHYGDTKTNPKSTIPTVRYPNVIHNLTVFYNKETWPFQSSYYSFNLKKDTFHIFDMVNLLDLSKLENLKIQN